ncbi:unnamed protein product [Moneuplotes crassus]|uniref:Ap4A phosphorylase 1/2 N-terminal domain-containing protein n=1 Tax=Euplotes crassus TaxID=5936 RepID=A0AAD1UPH5_EUPCR|nr:unnamed protein product [Moneuplotes crassus]
METVRNLFQKLKDSLTSLVEKERRTKVFVYGSFIVIIMGAATYYFFIQKRRQQTVFQRQLIELNNLVFTRINRNKNVYLQSLFHSFNEISEEEKKKTQKLRKKKLRERCRQSDPLLPPFEVGYFISDISNSHYLMFDSDPIFKGQMLLATKDFSYQNLLLSSKDIEACLRFIASTSGFCLYQSNEKVGAKFNHKHMHACLPESDLDLMESYTSEISNRRANFHKYTEVIHASCKSLPPKFSHILVGFEKITQKRKSIALTIDNIRERAKSIHKLYLQTLDRLKILKNAYKKSYIVILTEDWMLVVKKDSLKQTESSMSQSTRAKYRDISEDRFNAFTFCGVRSKQ